MSKLFSDIIKIPRATFGFDAFQYGAWRRQIYKPRRRHEPLMVEAVARIFYKSTLETF